MADSPDVLRVLEDLSIHEHLLSKLKYAHATTRAALETELGSIGVTIPQFLALAAIEENAHLSSAELARMSYVTPQAMITLVARMQTAQLITRAPAARGGRSLTLRLTAKGTALLDEARAHAYTIERYILEMLGPDRYAALLSSLDCVTDAVTRAATVTKTPPWTAFLAQGHRIVEHHGDDPGTAV